MTPLPLVVDFKDIDKGDVPLVGGKNANLGEMIKAGFPVPPGFAITVRAYDLFLEENSLVENIYKILAATDVNDPAQLDSASKRIQKIVQYGKIPDEVRKEVISSYKKLSGAFKKSLVAVRSSATAEDAPGTSFAGQQATFLNVSGEANLLEKVKECWASLFTARSIFYRVQNKIKHEKVKVSVAVQKMIQSEVSGVMFSIDPVTNDKDRIIIESVWGLGEMIVQGSVVPDTYVVQKDTFAILSKEISDQSVQLVRVGTQTKETEVPKKIRGRQKLTNEEIVAMARLADKLQKHYFFPQDAEWAKEKGKLYLVQTRPVTTIAATTKKIKSQKGEFAVTQIPILTGSPASPGMGTGTVRILKSPKELGKVDKGDVLVARMTSPDYVPAMKKASAIVTDEGGQTSHAAIVSRELGIPCVVGTKMATATLKEGAVVTVNGESGQIFLGAKTKVELTDKPPKAKKHTSIKTATKVYVNLAEPERANEIAKLNVDGVGLLRAEFMIANIGIHPKEAIKRKEQGKFIEKLSEDLTTFCRNFYPRPVTYRATDFKTNEYRSLPGGKFWEPEEPNPMLGFRGAYRYVASPEVFNLELTAIKKVREKYDNLHLMIPFVRSPQELAKVRRLVATEDLFEKASFKFWMMVEIPVNVIQIDDFIKVGIDGVSIGSNDLTMLVEGTDRDNAEVASEFNEMAPAVLWSLKRVIRKCNNAGVTSSICGQAPSEHEELVKKLVRWGITSISVNPDVVDRVREVVSEAEKEI
ncbi:MAG: Phosphoenolpyruvate synthase [Candidatus Woesebacteria bacterium GW2011_GWB1_45_5]|uniref:Phosphoenolpyruvate synthase n=1 Tax=Candidatus Woesebacteria bacterium GW2011_GWB1_45_5 TaxID=1618581 RepID=A0A0G1PWL8_9BACT|nr:MAG: Phosphoenolpyruvate synthase [Candidatus Woesebacteria bacterium GW2011_GWB1_45_5]